MKGIIRQHIGPVKNKLAITQTYIPILSFLVAPVIRTMSVKAPKAKIIA